MAESPTYTWPLPDGTTSPPDVAGWLAQLGNAADATVSTRILYGPVGSQPTLEDGQLFAGY
jgi:hypothetical protein